MHSSSLPKTLLHFHIGTPTKKSCKNLPIHPTQFATLKIESKTNVTQAVAFFIFGNRVTSHLAEMVGTLPARKRRHAA
jgi:hypothetical protein